MKRKIVISIFIVVLVVGVLVGTKALQFSKVKAANAASVVPPTAVSSAVAHEEKWQGSLKAVGSVAAVQGVQITTELAGTVQEIAFESGTVVSKGDLLVRLDTSTEDAQLRSAQAQVDWARISAERARALWTNNTLSQSELDFAEAGLKQSQGNADAIRATIEKKTIRAPFAGQLGIRLVNLGEYLDTGKPVVSLQALQPIHADFSLPQQDLARLETGMRVRLVTDTYPDKHFDGTLSAINPDLDSATRSVGLQATFDNPEKLLKPGMFSRVEVLLPDEQTVLVIPSTSILSAPFGDSVYVIEQQTGTNNTDGGLVVRQQFIRTGQARGDFIAVEMGLKPGEKVVSSGLFKLRNGASVIESNELTPKAAEKPRPSDG